MRQLVYTVFISRNHELLHLWSKENLVKHQKVSKHYENDFLYSFLLLFMSLLTAPIVKNSHIYARIYFIFLKNFLKQTWKSSNTKFWPQWKDRESSYEGRQILATALILVWDLVEGLRVTKIVLKITFEGVWGELKAKNCFQRQSFIHNIYETNSSFHAKYRNTGRV